MKTNDEILEQVDVLQMSLPQWCSDGDYAITVFHEMWKTIRPFKTPTPNNRGG